MKRSMLVAVAYATAAAAFACADTASFTEPISEQIASSASTYTLTGRVRGPYRSNICGHFSSPPPSTLRVLAFRAGENTFSASDYISCPDNRYTLTGLADGDYTLVFRAYTAHDGSTRMPRSWIEPGMITISGASTNSPITVGNAPLAEGGVTLDGVRAVGAAMDAYALVNGSQIWMGTSTVGPTAWLDDNDMDLRLPKDLQVIWDCGGALLGVDLMASSTSGGPITFSGTDRTLACSVHSGGPAAMDWTHRRGDLWLTMWPGFFDVRSIVDEWGTGWGMQWPVGPEGPASREFGSSPLYHGGLTLGFADEIISGAYLAGYSMECGAECAYDFGQMFSTHEVHPDGARRINFVYETNGATPGKQIWVRQSSWETDGMILVRYSIRNDGASDATFNPGLFMDFDVAPYNTNVAGVAMSRRLMYTRGEDGRHFGTYLIRQQAAGTYARVNFGGGTTMTLQEQIDAMSGALQQKTGGPGDIHYFHSASAITLEPGRTANVWFAILAGDSRDALVASANEAEWFANAIEASLSSQQQPTAVQQGPTMLLQPAAFDATAKQ